MAKQPAVTPHGDPNVMVSPMSGFIRMHIFSEFGALAVFVLAEVLFMNLGFGLWFEILLSIICTLFWVVVDFRSTLQAGMRDRNLVKYNYIKFDKWKGLKSGLFAQIPGLVVIIVIWITHTTSSSVNDWARLFYFILYAPVSAVVGHLENISQLFWLLPLWICPAVSALAYHLGYNEVPFLAKIMYSNRSRSKKLR